jgi:hypothetical protein
MEILINYELIRGQNSNYMGMTVPELILNTQMDYQYYNYHLRVPLWLSIFLKLKSGNMIFINVLRNEFIILFYHLENN